MFKQAADSGDRTTDVTPRLADSLNVAIGGEPKPPPEARPRSTPMPPASPLPDASPIPPATPLPDAPPRRS